MKLTTFVLRIKEADETFSVAAMDLPSSTTIEDAIQIALDEVGPGRRIERITDADTKASLTLQTIARAPKGFGA